MRRRELVIALRRQIEEARNHAKLERWAGSSTSSVRGAGVLRTPFLSSRVLHQSGEGREGRRRWGWRPGRVTTRNKPAQPSRHALVAASTSQRDHQR